MASELTAADATRILRVLIYRMPTSAERCADPSRYLLGPNGRGEYVCHKARP